VAPKSTGLELFNAAWLDARLAGIELPAQDVQRSLAELTARTVAAALVDTGVERLLVCGGGAHNAFLLARLAELMPAAPLTTTAEYGLHPDWVEASLFAWLARERLRGSPQATPPITGARHAVLLGDVHQP